MFSSCLSLDLRCSFHPRFTDIRGSDSFYYWNIPWFLGPLSLSITILSFQDDSHFSLRGESFGMKILGSFVSFCFVKKLLKDLGWQQPQQLPSKTCQRTKPNAENLRHVICFSCVCYKLLHLLLATARCCLIFFGCLKASRATAKH